MFLSRLDSLIGSFDRALRVVNDVVEPRRPSPSFETESAELTPEEKRQSAALMRVNHAGEICAQALYQGQAAATVNPRLKTALAGAAQEEIDHIAWTGDRIRELGGRTSVLNPLWYAGSFAIGFTAGKLGDSVNLGFLAETERQVGRHLEGHLARLSPADTRTRVVVEEMARDEAGHAALAERLGAARFPSPVKAAMTLASRVMTSISYHI